MHISRTIKCCIGLDGGGTNALERYISYASTWNLDRNHSKDSSCLEILDDDYLYGAVRVMKWNPNFFVSLYISMYCIHISVLVLCVSCSGEWYSIPRSTIHAMPKSRFVSCIRTACTTNDCNYSILYVCLCVQALMLSHSASSHREFKHIFFAVVSFRCFFLFFFVHFYELMICEVIYTQRSREMCPAKQRCV